MNAKEKEIIAAIEAMKPLPRRAAHDKTAGNLSHLSFVDDGCSIGLKLGDTTATIFYGTKNMVIAISTPLADVEYKLHGLYPVTSKQLNELVRSVKGY